MSVFAVRRARAWTFGLLFVLVGLAGCTDEGKEPEEDFIDTHDPDSPTQTRVTDRGLIPPEWDYGDWWRYTDTFGDTTTYVVTDDTPLNWTMDVDDPQTAFYDARFDISFVGTIRKPDLAGQQGDDWVEYIRWPLVDGLGWTTMWDGVELAVTAHDLGERVFRMEARDGGTLVVQYTYDHDIRWFTGFTFYDEAGGSFGMTLDGAGKGFDRDLYRYTLESVWNTTGPDVATGVGQGSTQFTVTAAHTDVWVSWRVACGAGTAALTVRPVASPAAGVQENVTCPFDGTIERIVAAQPGEWTASVGAAHPGDEADYAVDVLLRTLSTVRPKS